MQIGPWKNSNLRITNNLSPGIDDDHNTTFPGPYTVDTPDRVNQTTTSVAQIIHPITELFTVKMKGVYRCLWTQKLPLFCMETGVFKKCTP
jgi:hypothetical protein